MDQRFNREGESSRLGLCANCKYSRVIESPRQSIFYLCERSFSDRSFPKYPQLPVLQCSGYVAKGSGATTSKRS